MDTLGCVLWLLVLGLALLISVWDPLPPAEDKKKVGCLFGSHWEPEEHWQEEAELMDLDKPGAVDE